MCVVLFGVKGIMLLPCGVVAGGSLLCYAMLCYSVLTIISMYFRIPLIILVIVTLITLYCHLNAFSTCQGEIIDKHTRTHIKKKN
jgi:hypothetical protein